MTYPNLVAGGFGLHKFGFFGALLAALLAAPVVYLFHGLGGFPLVVTATLVAALEVWRAAGRATTPLVSDRFVGQMVGYWALSAGLWFAGVDPSVFPWPGVVGGFVICQLATALPPIAKLGRAQPMLDDLIGGAVASGVVLLGAAIAHGWLA